MDFVVIDVETANPDLASICQGGVAIFSNGKFAESWSSLVNPNDYFDTHNVSVHGITEGMVVAAPHWVEIHERLKVGFSNQILASHTPFDRTAIRRACEKASTSSLSVSGLIRRGSLGVHGQSFHSLATASPMLPLTSA